MSPWWWLAAIPALWLLDRALLAAAQRGWIYWRKSKPSGASTLGNAFLEVHSLLEPDKRHMLELRLDDHEEDDESGAPPS